MRALGCRNKVCLDSTLSDRQMFERLPLGDPWCDADLSAVFFFLYESSSTHVPNSWQQVMKDFAGSLKDAVGASPTLLHEYNSLVRP